MPKAVAGVNIVGPDGKLIQAGDDIPDTWEEDLDLLVDLVEGGGVVLIEDEEDPDGGE